MTGRLFLILGAVFLAACSDYIIPEGEITDRNMTIPGNIYEIEVGDGIKLVLDDGIPAGQAVIRTHENVQQYIKAEFDRDDVIFTVDARRYKNLDVTVIASLSQYRDFTASGGSEIYSADAMLLDDASFDLSGGSMAVVAGECRRADIDCSGGSNFSGYDLSVARADVDVSGGSVLSITVTDALTGEISGGSKIYYKGRPSILNVENSGGSQIVACD